jgi:phage terminase large subunit-like protein
MNPSGSIFGSIADALECDWASIARPEQLPPSGDWSIWVISAGRGFGKTRSGAEWVRSIAEAASVGRIALVGPTAADVRDTMVEGESGLLAIAPSSNRPVYEPSKRRLTWPNGVQAAMFSSEEPDRLRGPQHGAAWCDELAAWRNTKQTWDMLQFGLRLGKRPRQVITTTPKPIKLLRELLKRAGADLVVTHGSTYDNRANLAETFFSQIVKQYEGTRIGRQELKAELLEDTPGALWTHELIEEGRRAKADVPPMRRIVVAIDPSVSVSEASDETGIIAAGLGVDGHGYVLEDASGKFSPIEWARRAVTLYHKLGADRIIAEANQGGAMVETTIRTVDANVPFKGVHASRGKITRAEPIAALAEQFRIHLVGGFPELEDQLCTYAAGSSGSPDRFDAMVWAFTELMLDSSGNTGMLDYYRFLAEGQAPAPHGASSMAILRCPPGTGIVCGLSRKEYTPVDGIIHEVSIEDAGPLRRAGFVDVAK